MATCGHVGVAFLHVPAPPPARGQQGGAMLMTSMAKAHSWAPRRMLLRRRASVALFLTVFFTAWICSTGRAGRPGCGP